MQVEPMTRRLTLVDPTEVSRQRLGLMSTGRVIADQCLGSFAPIAATMRFAPEANHGANAGLIHARNFMDEIHQQFPWYVEQAAGQ